ncbi:MAG: 2-oxoglutarate dehydrogenase complex dihydrolipoyllysine-residue succinyltransferase [Pseudomonadota bacterium]
MATEIRVPTLGESVTEATIAQWLKKEGDAVNADEPLVELETDKVSVEVPAPVSGVLSEITAKDGDTVEVGALLGALDESGAAKSNGSTPAPEPAAAPAPASSGGGDILDITVPQAGESVTEAEVGEIFVKVGDAVKTDDPIVSLETDKASMDVPAPADGAITEISVAEGDVVEVGALLAKMEAGAAASAQPAASGPAPQAAAAPSSAPAGAPLAPSVQRIVSENNLDAGQIPGSGKDGRVTKGDALAFLERGGAQPAATKAPSAPRELGPREERVKMTRLRQTIARRLKEAQNAAAMLTTYNDVDMTAVMDVRKQYKELFEKKHGVKLGFMGLFVKACVHALKEIPDVNAEIDGADIIYKNHYDIGVAVGSDKGLVVPVVRDADMKSLAGIEAEIGDFGARARKGELKLEEMQGGTFTISNGGVYGSLMSSPILNAPQSGILGMHRIEQRPVVRDGQVVIRPMMYLALSYDHRIVDGKGAVTFLVRVKESLEDPKRLLLDL